MKGLCKITVDSSGWGFWIWIAKICSTEILDILVVAGFDFSNICWFQYLFYFFWRQSKMSGQISLDAGSPYRCLNKTCLSCNDLYSFRGRTFILNKVLPQSGGYNLSYLGNWMQSRDGIMKNGPLHILRHLVFSGRLAITTPLLVRMTKSWQICDWWMRRPPAFLINTRIPVDE